MPKPTMPPPAMPRATTKSPVIFSAPGCTDPMVAKQARVLSLATHLLMHVYLFGEQMDEGAIATQKDYNRAAVNCMSRLMDITMQIAPTHLDDLEDVIAVAEALGLTTLEWLQPATEVTQ